MKYQYNMNRPKYFVFITHLPDDYNACVKVIAPCLFAAKRFLRLLFEEFYRIDKHYQMSLHRYGVISSGSKYIDWYENINRIRNMNVLVSIGNHASPHVRNGNELNYKSYCNKLIDNLIESCAKIEPKQTNARIYAFITYLDG